MILTIKPNLRVLPFRIVTDRGPSEVCTRWSWGSTQLVDKEECVRGSVGWAGWDRRERAASPTSKANNKMNLCWLCAIHLQAAFEQKLCLLLWVHFNLFTGDYRKLMSGSCHCLSECYTVKQRSRLPTSLKAAWDKAHSQAESNKTSFILTPSLWNVSLTWSWISFVIRVFQYLTKLPPIQGRQPIEKGREGEGWSSLLPTGKLLWQKRCWR